MNSGRNRKISCFFEAAFKPTKQKLMHKLYLILLSSLILSACNVFRKTEVKSTGSLNTQTEKFSYALGMSIGENLSEAGLDSVDVNNLVRGINDVLKNKEKQLTTEEASFIVSEYIQSLEQRKAEINKEVEQKFFERNKKQSGVKTTQSGLQYEVIKEGEGPAPSITDQVTVHYHGTLMNGTVFDSSVERGEPMTFPVSSVIPGMQEALLMMPVGSKWKIYVPSVLAYGETGAGGVIEPNSPLIFEVELLKIE
jgi:FKBP-type peptidyl-prolyl cis-trans isomerase